MPSGRLQQQFIRLWQCCEGQSQETTLNELAELLNCSRRHMRTLLNTMQQQGWLNWEAEAGRGKRSRLTFLYTGPALQQQRERRICWSRTASISWSSWWATKPPCARCWSRIWDAAFVRDATFCGCFTTAQ